jgi:hypothetical protein
MKRSVYAVLGANSGSLHAEIDRNDLTLCSPVMVEKEREIRGDGGNHHEKLGLKRISGASEFTIFDTAGNTPDPPGTNNEMACSEHNQ